MKWAVIFLFLLFLAPRSPLLGIVLPLLIYVCWDKWFGPIRSRPDGGPPGTDAEDDRRQRFLFYLSVLMAKMAKADARVDQYELRAVGQALGRLGLSPLQCQYCVSVFRHELESPRPADVVALCAALQGFSVELREILYEILWNIACADGVLTENEKRMLRDVVGWMNLRPGIYEWYYHQRVHAPGAGGGYAGGGSAAPDMGGPDLADAYQLLGCSPAASPEELRAAYHEKAKRYHPDLLRAQGLPEGMIGEATRKMAEINAAWDRIRRERGL